ncbi:hypothetical protein F8388_026035 [Cannabis sativa]|uniref:Uncharacterized protein n=1 Tax=Cannabis sativa TaxID=3483 RepID=A0A7J6ECH3_CANSA|nr:hypothetical protein F8388_026035 [Cannabis sativa]
MLSTQFDASLSFSTPSLLRISVHQRVHFLSFCKCYLPNSSTEENFVVIGLRVSLSVVVPPPTSPVAFTHHHLFFIYSCNRLTEAEISGFVVHQEKDHN